MPEITLEAIEARHNEVTALIAKYKAEAPRALNIGAIAIELAAGEHYAGAVLNADGTVKHHLVLLADKPDDTLSWEEAKAWAASVDGSLPDRQEAALIYANCKPHVDARWHWTSEAYGASFAWSCYVSTGFQFYSFVSSAGAARAVRRLKP